MQAWALVLFPEGNHHLFLACGQLLLPSRMCAGVLNSALDGCPRRGALGDAPTAM